MVMTRVITMVMTKVITIDEISSPEVAFFERSADQVENWLSPLKLESFCQALTKTSCVRVSACCASLLMRGQSA